MAKAKRRKKAPVKSVLDKESVQFIAKEVPHLRDHYLTLLPFDDVISGCGARKGDGYFYIDIDCGVGVWSSGDYDTYGAKVYADKVVLFMNTHSGDEVYCEEYATTLPRLWDFLRQVRRPMHSFGEWQPLEGK